MRSSFLAPLVFAALVSGCSDREAAERQIAASPSVASAKASVSGLYEAPSSRASIVLDLRDNGVAKLRFLDNWREYHPQPGMAQEFFRLAHHGFSIPEGTWRVEDGAIVVEGLSGHDPSSKEPDGGRKQAKWQFIPESNGDLVWKGSPLHETSRLTKRK